MISTTSKTAFVFAGGGSLGAVQVGMLRELTRHGLKPDLVVGSSVGPLTLPTSRARLTPQAWKDLNKFGAAYGDIMCFP